MKRLKNAAIGFLVFYLLICTAMFLFQEKLIFLPSKLPQEYVYNFERPYHELFIDTPDGARLNALHFPVNNSKGIILYFHGNAGDLSRWGEVVAYFEQFHYDVLVMDYRTYGKSTGKIDEILLYKDAELFYSQAMEYFPEDRIVVYGRSLGTTFATHVASLNSPSQLILESPFYSLKSVAKERYWFLPVKPLLKYTFPTYDKLKEVGCNVTLLHGTNDRVVPFSNSERLQKTLPKEQIKLIPIPEGSHNDLVNFSEYQKGIRELLTK